MHPTAAEELVTFKAPSYRYRDGGEASSPAGGLARPRAW